MRKTKVVPPESHADPVDLASRSFSLDAMDSGHDRAGKHVHDRSSCFSRRLRLHGDVTARTANRVVDPVGIGPPSSDKQL